jgi:hypothetical protein
VTTFFSVDVESSALTPWEGHLLTVGIQIVQPDGSFGDRLYVRIDRTDLVWLADGRMDGFSEDTGLWWAQQAVDVQGEAFGDPTLLRHTPVTAARMIYEFVVDHEPDDEGRVFVANPVAFDKMWVDSLFAETGVANPFHYRSLCLRSMKFGMRPASAWGDDRTEHRSTVPHHALHDAIAQARDLSDMLAERDAPQDLAS